MSLLSHVRRGNVESVREKLREEMKWRGGDYKSFWYLNTPDNGWTLLHSACFIEDERDKMKMFELLLDYGADVNARGGGDKVTPLHLVASRLKWILCGMLIERGADLDAKDKFGAKPLSVKIPLGLGISNLPGSFLFEKLQAVKEKGIVSVGKKRNRYCEEQEEELLSVAKIVERIDTWNRRKGLFLLFVCTFN